MILTQQKLIQELKKHDIRVCRLTIQGWVRSGCPTVPGGKKPRFILGRVLGWLEAADAVDPLTLDVRDRLYLRNLKRTA